MREIKFRGLNKNGSWIFGDVCTGFANKKYIMPSCYAASCLLDADENYTDELSIGGWICIQNPETIGQFTGIKDANGVEIYEGDIVEITRNEITIWGDVFFEKGCFKVKNAYCISVSGDELGCFASRIVKVIGNIHENAELLETE